MAWITVMLGQLCTKSFRSSTDMKTNDHVSGVAAWCGAVHGLGQRTDHTAADQDSRVWGAGGG